MKKKYLVYLAIIFIVLAIVAAVGFAILQIKLSKAQSVSQTTTLSEVVVNTDEVMSAPVPPTDYTQPLATKYVTGASVWPPKVTTTNKAFSCTDTQKDIQGNMYCIKKDAEGAAGSTYTTYTYKTKVGEQLATTTFTLRTVHV